MAHRDPWQTLTGADATNPSRRARMVSRAGVGRDP